MGKPTTPFRRPARERDREQGADRYDIERLKRRVLEGVEHWVAVANRAFAAHPNMPLPIPECRFDLLGKCAGQACFPAHGGAAYIRINVDLLERYPVEMVQESLAHEMAHVVQRRIWRESSAHGREWQSVMAAFGKKPTRLHTMTVKPSNSDALPYHCGCHDRAHYLAPVHQKMIAQGRQLTCRRCEQPLVPAPADRPRSPSSADPPTASYQLGGVAVNLSVEEHERLRRLGYLP